MTTLDSLFESTSHWDLLKLDVQGAEHLVLAGARETLKQTSLIWTEVSFVRLYEEAVLFHDLYQTLKKLGFRLLEIQEAFRSQTGELLQADALFARVE